MRAGRAKSTSPPVSAHAGISTASRPWLLPFVEYPSAPEIRSNLPAQPTPLIGRERERQTAAQQLLRDDVRLLTITGPPGIGKTRLAIALAVDLLQSFPHGTFFVDLASINDPALVAPAIAEVLGLGEEARPLIAGLQHHLRRQRTLLLLDNFEQLIPAGRVVADLLAACPLLKILVTSREALRLRWEHLFPLSPLPLPGPACVLGSAPVAECPAMYLLVQRAQAVRPDFALTGGNAPVLAQICISLEGIPLALELTASQLDVMSPDDLLRELRQGAVYQLAEGSRDLPDRHSTLRDAVGWSYRLLSPQEQELFRRVAVFTGGFTLGGAQAVCGLEGDLSPGVKRGLCALVRKSLLRLEDARDAQTRFQMLETIRQYGLEQLAATEEESVVRGRHAAFYLALAEQAESFLSGPERQLWLGLLAQEYGNLRAALVWFLACGNSELALRLGSALWAFWQLRRLRLEGEALLGQLLALPGATARTEARARLLSAFGEATRAGGDFTAARERYEEALDIFRELDNKLGVAWTLRHLAFSYMRHRAIREIRPLLDEALLLFRELDDKAGIGVALSMLGIIAAAEGDSVRARSLSEESLVACRASGDPWALASGLVLLARTSAADEDWVRARALSEEGLTTCWPSGDRWLIVSNLANLALAVLHLGDCAAVRSLYAQVLAVAREEGDIWLMAYGLEGFAMLAAAESDPELSAQLSAAAEAQRERIHPPLPGMLERILQRRLEPARLALGTEALASARARGRAMSLEEAIDVALRPPPDRSAVTTPAAGHSRGQGNGALSPRESEIAVLVTSGLTNTQIAAQLVISRRTVQTHVNNILHKLEFTSRSQLAAWAARQQLNTST